MFKINHCDLILDGIKEGDQIGGPYKLAKIFSKSLELNNGFIEDDLRKRYLDCVSNLKINLYIPKQLTSRLMTTD